VDEPDDTATPAEHVVERQGIDLNEYTLKHILPGAAEMCEEGRLREVAAERDLKPFERRVVYATEVRGMMHTVNGIIQEQRGWYKTTSPLPHGIKPIMGKSDAELRWCYANALRAQRVAKTHREALNMAGGNAITFVIIGGGIEVAR
jgi:hypothetical protein